MSLRKTRYCRKWRNRRRKGDRARMIERERSGSGRPVFLWRWWEVFWRDFIDKAAIKAAMGIRARM
jgi:hypothetical protein